MNVPLLDLKRQYQTIKAEIDEAMCRVVGSQIFILGAEVKNLEKEIAEYCGAQYAIGCASGTDALLLALMATDIGPGDEVITSPYTFFATAGSIHRLGATPVFVDINPETYNIDTTLIKPAITARTKAIIPVHLFGQCADMDDITTVAKEHNLVVIEDAAQAIGATYKEKRACTLGDIGCLSFFPSKNLGGFGDGGMVVTNNAEYADKVELLRVHGSRPKYYHSLVGLNSRLDALQAAVLRVKLKYLDGWSAKRQENAACYDQQFRNAAITTPHVLSDNISIYNQYMIRVEDRNGLEQHLKDKSIGNALYYPVPLHLQECFSHLGYKEGDCPESERAARETIALPVFPEMTEEERNYVTQSVMEFVQVHAR